MKNPVLFCISLLLLITLPDPVWAAEGTGESRPAPAQWWQVLGGIIAVPTGLVGLVYTLMLIKKTRLEVRKTELEIKEKEGQLGAVVQSGALAEELVKPIVHGERVLHIILRFILLSVSLFI
ncbi:MAG TPA: hypothetical protein VH092_01055, partial [Urbifossiella sp.]|nr:hypothetical protein [Urbifossiella sp.]